MPTGLPERRIRVQEQEQQAAIAIEIARGLVALLAAMTLALLIHHGMNAFHPSDAALLWRAF